MISNTVIFLMFGVIFFAGGIFAKHPPGLFLTRFETPDDFYSDQSAFSEKRLLDEQRAFQSKWPWAKLFESEFIRDHQRVRPDPKNEVDGNEINDFPEYSTELLPVPQGLVQNYIKGKTAKKNSNQYMSVCHFKICNMGRKRNTRHLH
ncbi:hypothetical protein Bhyg_01868 [Pseudolycoriella hygida]|uniref:Uncharacterized protein n=1 Tax=Pseudolycoriella hygida TaxID=35572 RepID=A0A9Q0S7V0_9DIPT|nr:hypothetical protein Bhyg_01868 [Pseudolycoriella hygida]